MVEPLLDSTRLRFVELEEKQRQFDEFFIEPRAGIDPVASLSKWKSISAGSIVALWSPTGTISAPNHFYDHYTNRGQTENFIKAFKNHLSMDRLSCHRFLANQFRLLLHALAYQMFVRLRDYLHGTPGTSSKIETLRRRVLKIGARIRQTTRRIWVHLSSAFPNNPLPPRLESPQLQLASPSSPEKPLRHSSSPALSEIHSPNHSNASPTDILRKSACHNCQLGPAGLFKQDVAFRDRTGPRKRNLLRASRLGRIDKVRPIRQNMPIW